MVYFIIQGVAVFNFLTKLKVFPEDHFCLSNSVDPDEMPHYAAFNLDLLCLKLLLQIKYAFIPLLTE